MEVYGKRAETDAENDVLKSIDTDVENNIVKRAESDEENYAAGVEMFCQPCTFENVTSKANGICLECEEHMCNTCFRHHLKGKQCRHHQLVDMNNVFVPSNTRKENEEKCRKHDNETIKFYCRIHEIVGCGDCIILEHSTCKPAYIKDVSKDFQESEELKGLLSQLEQLEITIRENDEKIQNNRNYCEEMHEDALDEIRKFREDINKYLDKAEANIISETEHLNHENETSLDKLQQNCEQLSSKIETLKPKLDTKSHRDNVLFIHAVKSKTIIQEIEQEVAELQTKNKVKQFKFVPDKELVSIVTSARKLGNWNRAESKLCIDGKSAELLKEDNKPVIRDFACYSEEREVRPGSVIGSSVHDVWRSYSKEITKEERMTWQASTSSRAVSKSDESSEDASEDIEAVVNAPLHGLTRRQKRNKKKEKLRMERRKMESQLENEQNSE